MHHKKTNEKRRFSTHTIRYSTSRQSDHHSGAYLFIPDGQARDIPISKNSLVRLQRGMLTHRLELIDDIYTIRYELTNTNSKLGEDRLSSVERMPLRAGRDDHVLAVALSAHLQMTDDTELALRFSTKINNGAEFFTDLNGFQVRTSEGLKRIGAIRVDDSKDNLSETTVARECLSDAQHDLYRRWFLEIDHSCWTTIGSRVSKVRYRYQSVIRSFIDRVSSSRGDRCLSRSTFE